MTLLFLIGSSVIIGIITLIVLFNYIVTLESIKGNE